MSQKFGKKDGSEIGFRLLMIRLLNFAWIRLGGVLLFTVKPLMFEAEAGGRDSTRLKALRCKNK